MPANAPSELHDGADVRTLKQCPPLIDALGLGLLMPLVADVMVRDGVLSWDWDVPAMPDQLLVRSPIGFHVPEQTKGAPFELHAQMAVKFMSFWTLEVPKGWSILFTHPLNRLDLPFQTLAGVVDCDRFCDGLVHFPALWTDPAFEGVLPAGTPVAQAIPIPRGPLELSVTAQTTPQSQATAQLQEALQTQPGHYRKAYRASKPG